jgi:trehalose/maltose hydrolase-like predicted phosphorylase
MVVWAFSRAFEFLDRLDKKARNDLQTRIDQTNEELNRWEDIRHRLTIPLAEDGVLEQFEGYFDLEEVDWEDYKRRYEDIHRMDRILKAEGKSPDEFKVSKQADALMAYYNLEPDGVLAVLNLAGYSVEEDSLKANFNYYWRRTSHGSTLSALVHSYLAHLQGKRNMAWELYIDALTSDYVDIQGGTTEEGIHTGVLTGSVFLTLRAFAGLRLDGDHVRLAPNLPKTWHRLRFGLGFKGDRYNFDLHPSKVDVEFISQEKDSTELWLQDRKVIVENDQRTSFVLT